VRREVEAADADVAAAVEDRRDVLVTLLSDVARNYIELRGLQRQLDIAQRNIRSQRETLGLTQTRFNAGLSGELDVARSRALVAGSESALPVIETNIKASLHRLAVLLGEEPNALKRELEASRPIPVHGPEVPLGLPSELLRRRPDIRRAERQLAAATARVGVATADLFPRFSLTGALGLQSDQLRDLGSWDSRFWSIGPSVSWPVLDFGRIRSNIRVQDARAEQALVTYQRSVLVALEDVENALVRYAKEQTRRQYLQEAVVANRRAVELGQELYTRGLVDFLSVLESQRQLFQSEDQLVQSEQLVAAQLVALYKALGGGWMIEQPTAEARATVHPDSNGK
jgi:outer membrane protein, multidrug efflux system